MADSIATTRSQESPHMHPRLPTHGRVAVVRAINQPMVLERFPLPELVGSEALVRIRCATICGSDLHSFFGRRPTHLPGVLGHEMVGQIVDLGPGGAADYQGNPLRTGDRVTWSMLWSCGNCFYCTRGLRSKCERLLKFGHEELTADRAFFGGMGEYCLLPEGTAVFAVPEDLPDRVASPANCATATVAAVFRQAGPVAEKCVLIQGAAMLGQTACAMAATMGAAKVLVIEPDPRRRRLALRFGATAAIDGRWPSAEILGQVLELTAGRGADVAVELSGYPEAVELGVELLGLGGHYVLAGATFPSRPAQLRGDQLVRRLLHIVGVYNYNPEDLASALAFLSRVQGKYPFEELVEASFPLDEVNQAFDFAEYQRPPRVAVLP